MTVNYTGIESSKTGEQIPLAGNISLHSKYNPVREAENFAAGFDDKQLFFVIGGIAGGFHIESLLKNNSDRFIVAVENCKEDIDFLMKLPQVKKLSENNRVVFTVPEELFNTVVLTYLPALYGNLNTVFLRSWENLFPKTTLQIKAVIEEAVKTIKADFSVQSRFGKIWQRNILNNLKITEKHGIDFSTFQKKIDSTAGSKTAAIIAAGPSLDNDIGFLKENRDSLYIISTDTAYTKLTKSGIISDAVVCVDGQNISNCHFLKKICPETVFVMDLCCQTSSILKVIKNGAGVLFYESGHPLSVMAGRFSKSFVHLNSGSGTVTIAALDFAKKSGFKKYRLFGADFCYSNGKAYTRGTYLDEIYSKKQNRLINSETSYDRLLFRTELLKKDEGKFSTPVLEGYSKSLEYYEMSKTEKLNVTTQPFVYSDFSSFYRKELYGLDDNIMNASKNPVFYTLLPLMSFYELSSTPEQSYIIARCKTLQYN